MSTVDGQSIPLEVQKSQKIIEDQDRETKLDDVYSGKYIEISVSDTGIGIKPQDFDRIFKPLEQGDSSRDKEYEGTGMGLSLTKRLIELQGGKIWIESDGENKGSTFKFVIPSDPSDQ